MTRRLHPIAKLMIHESGLTLIAYVRYTFPDGVWGGDACGCTDDRCIGYHHDEADECGCLPVLLAEARKGDPMSDDESVPKVRRWDSPPENFETEAIDAAMTDDDGARFLGHCPACLSPMYGPCGHCISEANASGTTFEVQRLTTEVADCKSLASAVIERLTKDRDDALATLSRVRLLALEWVNIGATLENHADTMPGPRVRTLARSQMAMDHGWAIIKSLDTRP